MGDRTATIPGDDTARRDLLRIVRAAMAVLDVSTEQGHEDRRITSAAVRMLGVAVELLGVAA